MAAATTDMNTVPVDMFTKYAFERGGENSLVGLHKLTGLGRHKGDQSISTYGQTLEGKFDQLADTVVGIIAIADMWEIRDVAPIRMTDSKAFSGKYREFRTVRANIVPELGVPRKLTHREVEWVSESFRVALSFEYSLEQTFSPEGIKTIVLQIAQVASSMGYSYAMMAHEGYLANSCVGPVGGFQTLEGFVVYIMNAFGCINKSMHIFTEVVRQCITTISNASKGSNNYKMVVPPGTAYRLSVGDRSAFSSSLMIGDAPNQSVVPVTVTRSDAYSVPSIPNLTVYEARQLYDDAQQYGLNIAFNRTNTAMLEMIRIGATGEYFQSIPRGVLAGGYDASSAHKTRDYAVKVYDFDKRSWMIVDAYTMFENALAGWFDATTPANPSTAVIKANKANKDNKDNGGAGLFGGKLLDGNDKYNTMDKLYPSALQEYVTTMKNADGSSAKAWDSVAGKPFSVETIKDLLKKDIPLPFTVAGLRPNITFSTSPAYVLQEGAGFTTIGQGNAVAGLTTSNKSVEAHFSAYAGMHVPDKRKVQRIEDAKLNAYLWGGGLTPFKPPVAAGQFVYKAFNDYVTGTGTANTPSVMYVLLGFEDRLPSHLDFLGTWAPEHYGAATTMHDTNPSGKQYPTCDVYNEIYSLATKYRSRINAQRLSDKDAYTLNSGRNNLLLARGPTYTYSEATKDYTTVHHGQGGLGMVMNAQIQLNLHGNWESFNNILPGVVFQQ